MKNGLKLLWTRLVYFLLRPICGAPSSEDDVDIYASRMLTEFNKFHRLILPRFFSKMRIDQDSLNEVKEAITDSIPIYVTTFVGQLEYNYFNYLFLKESLPLAQYANGLSNWQWMTFKTLKKTLITRLQRKKELGFTPHPVSSGYVEKLIGEGESIFVRLRTTSIHDDLFWEIPHEDILQAVISAQRDIDKPINLIPQQFLWARRPTTSRRTVIDWIFGERENPGWLRKNFLFWRNYKRHALVQFGAPLNMRDFLDAHPALPDEELARILRNTLLSQIRQERKRITGPALKPRTWIIEHILESELVQKQIYGIASEKNKEPEEVKLLATKYAKEIAADINYTYIEFANRVLNWHFNSMYDGIQYNHEGLAKIKKISERSPIIFVPNHRSHVDYLLISNLLYSNDVAVPHVAAGINLAFWPLGKIYRHCGGFFIRRTFAGNPLYKAAFESYLRLLLNEGYCQEFFIEGGRSRTGKLRQPKMGMLSMLTQAMLDRSAQELYFVPASVTYDKVVEESTYIDESAGKAKKRERIWDLLKLRKHLKHRYGKIYVNFGEPISFKEIASVAGPDVDQDALRTKIVEALAYKIMSSINRSAVVTPTALVATAFLMEGKNGITSDELFKNIDLIRSYLEFIHAQLSDSLISEPIRSIKDVMHKLAMQKIIEPHQDFDPVYYALPQEKWATLDYQKNSIVHFLLPVAYIAASLMALLKKGRASFPRAEIQAKIEFLKGFFTTEFASHSDIISDEAVETTLEFLHQREVIEYDREKNTITVTTLGTDALRHYKSLVDNFIDAYKIVHYTCSRILPNEAISAKNLVRTLFQNGQHLLLLGKIKHPEAISQPIFENAIALFKTLGFLVEELPEEESKEKVKYLWDRTSPALEELQQELELFS